MVLGRERTTTPSLRLLLTPIVISGFLGDNPRDNKMRHSSSAANQISSIYSIACFDLPQQRYHSQSARAIVVTSSRRDGRRRAMMYLHERSAV